MHNQIDPGMSRSIPLSFPFSELPMSQNSQESLTDRMGRKRTVYVEMETASGYKQFPRNKHHAFRPRKKIWILEDKLIKTFYPIKIRTVRFLNVLVCVYVCVCLHVRFSKEYGSILSSEFNLCIFFLSHLYVLHT